MLPLEAYLQVFCGKEVSQFWRYVCKLNDAPCMYSRLSKVHVPPTSPSCRRESGWSWFRLVWRFLYDCRQKSSKLEILNAGRVLGPVRRRLGAASTVRELGEAVRLAARVVRLRHQQNRVEVQRLPGPGYRLRIADETAIHFTCNHTHQRSAVSGKDNRVLCQVSYTSGSVTRFLTSLLDIEVVYIVRLDTY